MDTEKLQLLVDNKLSGKIRSEFIREIKEDPKLKQELAHLIRIKEMGRSKIKMLINTFKNETNDNKFTKISLASVKSAAFGNNEDGEIELTNLPIKDTTLNDFLNDEDVN